MDLKTAPDGLKSSIDAEIEQVLRHLGRDYAAHSAGAIVDELSASVFSGGKRMRPLLCCWGHQAGGGEISGPILKAAASLELLHTFAILHDDIMDVPKSRRRRPPAHARVAAEQPGLAEDAAGRFGVSIAMLAGDLALVASDRLFTECGFPPDRLSEAWKPLSRMRLDAIAGQYLDLSLSGKNFSSETAAKIARLKSGSYSVRGPLAIGGVLAGAGDEALQALESYGESLGEAFQLADDLSGMFGDPRATGKDADSDLTQGKPTYLIALALQTAPPDAHKAIKAAWNNPEATPEQVAAARRAIAAGEAPGRVAARISQLTTEAKAALENPAAKNLQPEPCDLLLQLAEDIQTASRLPDETGRN